MATAPIATMADNDTSVEVHKRLWDFDAILDYTAGFEMSPACEEIGTDVMSADIIRRPRSVLSVTIRPAHLGDFGALWKTLGSASAVEPSFAQSMAIPRAKRRVRFVGIPPDVLGQSCQVDQHDGSSTDSDTSSDNFESTPPSSAPEDRYIHASQRPGREASTLPALTGKGRKQTRLAMASQRRRSVIATFVDPISKRTAVLDTGRPVSTAESPFRVLPVPFTLSESDTDAETQQPPERVPTGHAFIAKGGGSIRHSLYQHNSILPTSIISQQQQVDTLAAKLRRQFSSLPSQGQLYMTEKSAQGVHIFVDISNIIISFYEKLKQSRGIHKSQPLTGVPFAFASLAMILERGRKVTKRVIVGSHKASLQSERPKRPQYLADAEAMGYEISLLERVLKHKPSKTRKQRRSTGSGYNTVSGYSSGDENLHEPKVMSEQAVDEVLHMKLLESLVDTAQPATIVLASGDAAEAEYSGGFLRNVERALVKGWNVEIVAWHHNLSNEYRNPDFSRKWKGRFSIVELDGYLEDFLAIYLA